MSKIAKNVQLLVRVLFANDYYPIKSIICSVRFHLQEVKKIRWQCSVMFKNTCISIKFKEQITVKFWLVINFGVKARDGEWARELIRVLWANKCYFQTEYWLYRCQLAIYCCTLQFLFNRCMYITFQIQTDENTGNVFSTPKLIAVNGF